MKKVGNKVIIALVIIFIIALIFYRSTSLRSFEKMEDLANLKFKEKFDNRNIRVKMNDFHRLPLKDTLDNGIVFSWYYLLEDGDSANINIQVNNRGKFLQDEQFRITMNYKWGYLYRPESMYIQILPLKYKGDSLYLDRIVLLDDQDNYINSTDSVKLLIPTKKLLYFIKKGYFNVLKRYEDNTVVAFYEPVATLIRGNESKAILTAKIYFNDRYEVLIFPYDGPKELWDNYNKE
jgi:hypothetical protein